MEHGSDHADAVGADGHGVPGQLDGVGQIPGAHLHEHRDALVGVIHHGLSHQLALLNGEIHHLAGGAAGIQALQAVVDAVVHQVLQALDIDLVILGEGG